MNIRRIGSAALSVALLAQMAAALPVLPAAAAQIRVCSLAEFADSVLTLTQTDADRTLFEEIVYDPSAGTLSADGGSAQTAYGDLRIRNGQLMLQTGSQSSSGVSVQSGSSYAPFEEAAADYGYIAEESGDTVTITNEFQTARLIVKAAGSIDWHGAQSAAEGYNDLHILQYADAAEAFAAYQLYAADPAVQYVQPSHRVTLDAQAVADAKTYTEEITTGSYLTWGAEVIGIEDFIATYLNAEVLPEVVVAVIDTGINMAPVLFEGRILDGGINISDSGDDTVNDDLYHGTHVSGTICEMTPSNVRILPIKVFDLNGSASDEQIYLGMMFALEQNADVLNMSFGGLGVSPLEVEAMSIADENGVICCAAAGNNADDAGYYYPGSIASCITVGAVDAEMQRASFSNYGKSVDVVAPGVGIVSYVLGSEGQTEAKNGTSMATPHVSACCALLRSYDKTISPRTAESLLRVNAIDLGAAGFDKDFGWGLVNMAEFRWDDGICPAPELSLESGSFGRAQTVALTVDLKDAVIYYTTDGTIPSAQNGLRYTEPLEITETTVLSAIAVREGWIPSVPVEGVYIIGGQDVANAYEVQDGVLCRYRGIRNNLTVPAELNGQTVTAIGASAFAGNPFVGQITLPETVTEIGAEAFADCAQLTQITAPGVQVIGAEAFARSGKLKTAAFADVLHSAGAGAFSGCSALETVSAVGLTALPEAIFADCAALMRVDCPDVTVLGADACSGCESLTELTLHWENVTAIGAYAFAGCASYAGELCLPALETVGAGAFSGCTSLRRVSLPERITALPEALFADCSGLRLLQLPGVTQLADRALAVGSTSGMQTELDYSRLTAIGTEAFYGFSLGDGYDTVDFSSLRVLAPRMFAGASAGILNFPQITAVPSDTFADAAVSCVNLEQAAVLESRSLLGCSAVVLTDAAEQIAPDAFSSEMWVVALDEIPALEAVPEFRLSQEPLLMRVYRQDAVYAQHEAGVLRVLACGIDLQYQWYQITDEQTVLLEGACAAEFRPDTSVCGTFRYQCVMTDAGGKSEQYTFSVTVADTLQFASLEADVLAESDGTASRHYQITVAESGIYSLRAAGAAAVGGQLTDAAGRPVAAFVHDASGDMLTASLTAGEIYYLESYALWGGEYGLLLSAEPMPALSVAGCRVEIHAPAAVGYGTAITPDVTVYLPDGTRLEENQDYVLRMSQHNQCFRIAVYGIGRCGGYQLAEVPVYVRIPEDTPIPVEIERKGDSAVYVFVPKTAGTYYFYATYAPGYAAELTAYQRTGRYNTGTRYVSIRTKAVVADTPEGDGTVYAENSYSPVTGDYFNSSVQLNAGQPYYFICTADQTAEYALVITQTPHDIRKASIRGTFYCVYEAGSRCQPAVTVTLNGQTLTEGVDYQRIDTDSDVPGKATLNIVGMGLYYGKVDQQYVIVYLSPERPEEEIAMDAPTAVTCSEQRLQTLWFRAEYGETPNQKVRYRVLNERVSGGQIRYGLYRYDENTDMCTLMSPISGEANDYELKNGTYCIAAYRQYAEVASKANFTVLRPYSLAESEVTIGDAPYTGSEIPAPITVTAPDGTVLQEGRDYRIDYPDGNIMFGTVGFLLSATNRSYDMQKGSFEIYLDLPEDAPELALGAHEVCVTLNDRLAIYRVTPQTETTYTLTSTDVENIVLRVFSPEGEMLEQDYGNGTKSVKFTVPAEETRYLMVKFNGTDRAGTIRFRLETDLLLLSECTVVQEPQLWTGEQIAPQIRFYDGEYELIEGTDYRLRYTADDVNIGTATANYTGIGRYFGSCDVTYPIVAPNLHTLEEITVVPLLLNKFYTAHKTDEEYLVYRYTAGTETALNLIVYDAMCKLSVQLYNETGAYQDSIFIKPSGEMHVQLAAGETCYFLFSATDISGWNQTFKMVLHDENSAEFETVQDPEGGFIYRISRSRGYAEVSGIVAANPMPEQLILRQEIEGIAVTYVPEALFADLPAGTVVIGYAGCGVSYYADRYRFLYQQAADPTELPLPGDLNGDGRCSAADAVLLSAVLAEHTALDPALLDAALGDLNGDGMLDLLDLAALLNLLAEHAAALP